MTKPQEVTLTTIAIGLLLASWFHHKKSTPLPDAPTYSIGTVTIPDQPNLAVPQIALPPKITKSCFDLEDNYVAFLGPDRSMGLGGSCFGAFSNWKTIPPPKGKYVI